MESVQLTKKDISAPPVLHEQSYIDSPSTENRISKFASHPIYGNILQISMDYADTYLTGSFAMVLQSESLFTRNFPEGEIDSNRTSDADFLIDMAADSKEADQLLAKLTEQFHDKLLVIDQRDHFIPKFALYNSNGRHIAEIVFLQDSADKIRSMRASLGQREYITDDNLSDHLMAQTFRNEAYVISFSQTGDTKRLGFYPETPVRVVNEYTIFDPKAIESLVDQSRSEQELKDVCAMYYYVRMWNLRTLKGMIELNQELRSNDDDKIFVEPGDINLLIANRAKELNLLSEDLTTYIKSQTEKYYSRAYSMILRLLIVDPHRALRRGVKLFSAISMSKENHLFVDYIAPGRNYLVQSGGHYDNPSYLWRTLWNISQLNDPTNRQILKDADPYLDDIIVIRDKAVVEAGLNLAADVIDSKSVEDASEVFAVLITALGEYGREDILNLLLSVRRSVDKDSFVQDGWYTGSGIAPMLDKLKALDLSVKIANRINPVLNPKLYQGILTYDGKVLSVNHPVLTDIKATFVVDSMDYKSTSNILPMLLTLDSRVRDIVFKEIVSILQETHNN